MVEIRSYTLKPGTGDAFHALVLERSIPMLARWKVDVVAYGPSLHDDQAYVLIRAYDDLGERQASQDAFYGSAEWKEGPRDSLLAMIESYTTVVLDMDEAAIEALRTAGSRREGSRSRRGA